MYVRKNGSVELAEYEHIFIKNIIYTKAHFDSLELKKDINFLIEIEND